MKKLTGMWLMVAVFCMLAWVSQAAPRLVQLPWQMATRYDATHMLEFTYNDLTQTATNTAMVFTNTIAAPASVKFQGMLLDVAFDSATTTNAFSMTLSCGDGSSSTKWLNAKQVAADGTEVKTSWGTDYTASVALTFSTSSVVTAVTDATDNFVKTVSALSTNVVQAVEVTSNQVVVGFEPSYGTLVYSPGGVTSNQVVVGFEPVYETLVYMTGAETYATNQVVVGITTNLEWVIATAEVTGIDQVLTELVVEQDAVVTGTSAEDAYVVDGATGTSALASPLLNEQSSDVSIITTFGTAGDDRNHAELESGKVRLFFKVLNLGG